MSESVDRIFISPKLPLCPPRFRFRSFWELLHPLGRNVSTRSLRIYQREGVSLVSFRSFPFIVLDEGC